MGTAIVAANLSKVYRTYRKQEGSSVLSKGLFVRQYDEIHAAKNVSFKIEEGEFVGFLGPNGAGKTTVLKMLAGLLVPTSGTARVLGYIPGNERRRSSASSASYSARRIRSGGIYPLRESLELNRAIYEIDESRFRPDRRRTWSICWTCATSSTSWCASSASVNG